MSGRNSHFKLDAGVSKATLDAFYNGSNYILRLPRLLSTFYDVDHVTKVKKLLRRYRG